MLIKNSVTQIAGAATGMADKVIGVVPRILQAAKGMPVMGTFTANAVTGEIVAKKTEFPKVSDARNPTRETTTTAEGSDFTELLNSIGSTSGGTLSAFTGSTQGGSVQGGSTTLWGMDKNTVMLAIGVAAVAYFITKKG